MLPEPTTEIITVYKIFYKSAETKYNRVDTLSTIITCHGWKKRKLQNNHTIDLDSLNSITDRYAKVLG